MERSTCWSAAIVATMMAHGETPHGSVGVEKMVPAKLFVYELIKRGINVEREIRIKTREPNLPPYRL
jgi:hypothetical protein